MKKTCNSAVAGAKFRIAIFLPFYFVVGVLRLPPYFNDYVNDWQSFAAVLDEAIVRSSSRFLVSFQQKTDVVVKGESSSSSHSFFTIRRIWIWQSCMKNLWNGGEKEGFRFFYSSAFRWSSLCRFFPRCIICCSPMQNSRRKRSAKEGKFNCFDDIRTRLLHLLWYHCYCRWTIVMGRFQFYTVNTNFSILPWDSMCPS